MRKTAFMMLFILSLSIMSASRKTTVATVLDGQYKESSAFAVVPENGTHISNHIVTFGWHQVKDALEYLLQIGNDVDFSSVEIEVTTKNVIFTHSLSDNMYYWRVKVNKANGESFWLWQGAAQFTVSTFTSSTTKDLGVPNLQQHKDTGMLCLDGCAETGQHAWDRDHINRGCTHCDNYCVRAAIAMTNRYFDGGISQDRISYYVLGGGAPEDDLGHGRGLYPDETTAALSWALNGALIDHYIEKPTFNWIKEWLDIGRPILRRDVSGNWHATVIDGYEEDGGQFVHVIDPWTGTETSVAYDSLPVYEVWVPPLYHEGRLDEASVSTDSDGDGIVDFDESNRFGTDPYSRDSDGDGADDRVEVAYYTFITGQPDPNGNGIRMELDPYETPQGQGVGGIFIPVDKVGLLAPYIVFASIILVAATTTTIYAKRINRKRNKSSPSPFFS